MALMVLPLLLEGNTIPGLAFLGFEYVISICVFTTAFSMLLQNIKYLNKILIYVIVSTSSLGLLHIFCSCNIYNYHSSAMSKWPNCMDIGYIYMATNTYASGFIALCIKQNLQELKQYD